MFGSKQMLQDFTGRGAGEVVDKIKFSVLYRAGKNIPEKWMKGKEKGKRKYKKSIGIGGYIERKGCRQIY